jgi:hypothetical protein
MRAGTRPRSHDALRARRLLVVVAALLVAACSSERTIGPLTITPPSGWHVTGREMDNLKITNGTIADDRSTKPGTATAVFDVYVNSEQTVNEFEKALRTENVEPESETVRVGGYEAVIVAYETGRFGPATEVVFVPEWKVRIVYRAAYSDDAAFARNRPAFRSALRTIRFSGRPPARA